MINVNIIFDSEETEKTIVIFNKDLDLLKKLCVKYNKLYENNKISCDLFYYLKDKISFEYLEISEEINV